MEQELPKERERTPPREQSREERRKRRSPSTSRDRSLERRQRSPTPTKDRSHRSKKRSPSPRRDHASEERQRSQTPPKERSHHRRRHSPSPVRDRTSEERRPSPAPSKEHRHDRRRRSPTPTHDRLSEERKPSPPPSGEPSRERRRRRRSPEPSEISKEERRRSPLPNVVPPDSPKVSSKKSKKSGKKEKKDSKSSRRTERIETVEDRATRDERSRSTRRPESSQTQPPQIVSVEGSETDDHPPKDDRQVAAQDRPAKPRPRFDPAREHVAAQRIMDKRKVVQPPREHGRDPSTDGPPDTEAEVRQRRRYPPPPPPASSIRQTQSGHRSLASANPPPRRDSATESSQISERQTLRFRSHETPPQRPMPKRVVATSMVGSSAPPRLQDTSGRASRGDYYDQSQVRDDHMVHNISKRDRIGAPHKEEFHLWVVGNPYMHGQDISTLVNAIRTGVSNNHLLKNIGMIHNMIIHNITLNKLLQVSIGMRSNSNSYNNSCRHYRDLFSHQECNQVYNHLQAWDLMFKEPGKVLCHKVHQCNVARQQLGNNHRLVPSHHRIDNSHLILLNNTNLQVDTLDRDISKHFIHFTEGECSDT